MGFGGGLAAVPGLAHGGLHEVLLSVAVGRKQRKAGSELPQAQLVSSCLRVSLERGT